MLAPKQLHERVKLENRKTRLYGSSRVRPSDFSYLCGNNYSSVSIEHFLCFLHYSHICFSSEESILRVNNRLKVLSFVHGGAGTPSKLVYSLNYPSKRLFLLQGQSVMQI